MAYKLYYKALDGTRGSRCLSATLICNVVSFLSPSSKWSDRASPFLSTPFHYYHPIFPRYIRGLLTASLHKVQESTCRPLDNRAQSITRANFRHSSLLTGYISRCYGCMDSPDDVTPSLSCNLHVDTSDIHWRWQMVGRPHPPSCN